MQKNDELILNITDISKDGSGIGKYNGMAVFVPLAAVGDTLRVKILKVKKSCAYAKALEILTPSGDRIKPDCPVFNLCGGCVFRHIDYAAERKLKASTVYETVKRIGGIDMQPEALLYGLPERYRNKAQYPVSQTGKAGFYAFHSHRIIPCGDCLLQPTIFADVVEAAEIWIKENGISVYDEALHKGLLRHIYIRLAEKTGEIMVTLVINGDFVPFADSLFSVLKSKCSDALKSVMLNINKANTNVILGDKCVTLYGNDYITDILCGIKVRLSAMSFYQVNRGMAEKLYEKAAEYANPENKTVLDLYCGAGTIGLSLAKMAKEIIGVEIVPEAVKDAEFNAKLNGIKNARFICADAASAAYKLAEEKIRIDTVIVDPPRKGCSAELLDIIADSFVPERIVYVSCDCATLARDIAILSKKGYTLSEYTPVDLFPRTAHVETVCLLTK